ncbi:hypothetical protein D2Q93_02750 [Alicyclobacillaceae bacterium I2511]|nr:hypothetical protein D2Q93_02750 [Alicyclobacillaceae bacterium I2511]
MLVVQRYGRLGHWQVEVPSLVCFSELTADEFFVSAKRVREGVTIRNDSQLGNLVTTASLCNEFRAYRQNGGITLNGKAYRLGRIFDSSSGNTVDFTS